MYFRREVVKLMCESSLHCSVECHCVHMQFTRLSVCLHTLQTYAKVWQRQKPESSSSLLPMLRGISQEVPLATLEAFVHGKGRGGSLQ